jgi:hypothetical protein
MIPRHSAEKQKKRAEKKGQRKGSGVFSVILWPIAFPRRQIMPTMTQESPNNPELTAMFLRLMRWKISISREQPEKAVR